MDNKPMRLLLIEDDELQCAAFKKHVDRIENAYFIGITNSSKEALEYVKSYIPEGIILDIELHKGEGSGIEFLEKVKEYTKEFKPIIVVTTNSSSPILYNKLHEEGVDLIFYKQQIDYSTKIVISELLSLRKSLYQYNHLNNKNKDLMIETQADYQAKVCNKINAELDLIGISGHLKGRSYLYDAILFLIESNDDNESPFNYLANKYKKSSSSISRVMQTAINYAWRTSAPEELEAYYTAKINYHTGVPSPTEFIYYYANKIKKAI